MTGWLFSGQKHSDKAPRRLGRGFLPVSLLTLALLLLPLLAGTLWSWRAEAQSLAADLSSHLIRITAGFTGADVVLFGATEGTGDVVLVVTGPETDVTLRRKGRMAGIWLNQDSASFTRIPAFYYVASSRPLDEVMNRTARQLHQVGLEHLGMMPSDPDMHPDELRAFRNALLELKEEQGLYTAETGLVTFFGPHLFRSQLSFPSNVPPGKYGIKVYLLQDGEVMQAATTPLEIGKDGIGADVFQFAHRHAALYGLISIILALIAGWLADLAFNRKS